MFRAEITMKEPVTTITDYILACEVLVLGVLLLRTGYFQQQISMRLWAGAFFVIGIAALTGGTFHGFIDFLSKSSSAALWKVTVYCIAISTAFMLAATVYSGLPVPIRPWFLAAIGIQFILCIAWLTWHDNFRYVAYNYAPLMLVVLAIQIFAYRRDFPGAGWVICGILVSFAAAGIQLSGFRHSKNWNHNDIYHIIQMGAMYLFYRGAILARDTISTIQ